MEAHIDHQRICDQDALISAEQPGASRSQMKVAVIGLWHLGSVTAACLARAGHDVVAIDADKEVVSDLVLGKPPIFEPELEDACRAGIASGALKFSTDFAAVAGCEIIWIAYDTPTDENDKADVSFVEKNINGVLDYAHDDAIVIISSQVPVGFTRQMETNFRAKFPQKRFYLHIVPRICGLEKH